MEIFDFVGIYCFFLGIYRIFVRVILIIDKGVRSLLYRVKLSIVTFIILLVGIRIVSGLVSLMVSVFDLLNIY